MGTGRGRARTVPALVLLAGGLCAPGAAEAGQSPVRGYEGPRAIVEAVEGPARAPGPSVAGASHIRTVDADADTLLGEGWTRSATFRRLVEALEESDLFVYVEMGYLGLPAQLQFAAATPVGRYVRITINAGQEFEDTQVAWLGHELQHAVEVAAAPDVTSAETLDLFYSRFAQKMHDHAWCTPEAQAVTGQVMAELSANRQ
jgi:hypothetical protein